MKHFIMAWTVGLLLIVACQQSQTKGAEESNQQVRQESKSDINSIEATADSESRVAKILISQFKGIPDEVDGCSCYFSENKKEFEQDRYIFAAGFDSVAFVSINDKLLKLRLVTTEREPNTFGDHDHVDIYWGDGYKVTVDIKYVGSEGEEVWWNEGTLTIESRDRQKVSKKFVGECGC